MQREMRFREMMYCNLAASILAGGFGILLALRKAGLWALVAYHFGHIIVVCAAQFLVLRWIPRGRYSPESARRLGGYGIKMLAASLISTLYTSLRPLIIGRRFSTQDLGYYDRGQKFASTVSLNLDSAVQSVMFPVLSRSQDDKAQFLAILRRMKQLGCFIIFPVMLGLAAVSRPLILLLLKEQWLPTVPFLALLSIGEAQVPLTSSNLVALKSLGRSDIYAKQELLRRVLMVAVLAVSVLAFDSVEAIAVSFVISAWLDVWVTGLPIKKLLGYGLLDEIRDVWASGLSAALMALAVRALGLLSLGTLPLLLLQVLCGALIYLALNMILKNESLLYLLSLIKRRGAAV
jgi:O-antigen/teichoic acid export membrane protein